MIHSPKTICSVKKCEKVSISRGWCKAHYLRWYKTGGLRESEPVGFLKSGGRKPGFSHKQSTLEKISKANTGKKRTLEQIARITHHKKVLCGSEHYNWKGGITNERHLAMGQLEYKAWRNAVFKRDNYTCQICEQYGGVLHADHVKQWAISPELRLELANGRTLCVACHYYITFKRKMPLGAKWCNFTLTKKRG